MSTPTPKPAPTLAEAFAAVQAWQAATFGERSPLTARADKLVDESCEAREAAIRYMRGGNGFTGFSDVLAELADVAFLLADILRYVGADADALAAAIVEKLETNKRRQWAADASGKFSGSKEGKP